MREQCVPHCYNKSDHIAASSRSVWSDVIVPPQMEMKQETFKQTTSRDIFRCVVYIMTF